MEAQFQAEMNFAQSELAKVKDLNFLRKITKLLKERPSAHTQSFEEKTLIEGALASNEDIKAGRVYTVEQLKEQLEANRKSWK